MVVPFTRLGNLGIMWVGLGWVLDQPQRIALMLAGTVGVTETVKRVARRPRPAFTRLERLIGRQSTGSFPSGHAASSAAAAIVLTSIDPKMWPVWAGLAVLMAASRIYVGVHYPSDAAAGVAIGCLIAALVLSGHRFL